MPVRHALALWVLFTTLYLHRVGASFVRVSAAQHGRAGLRRNWLPLLIAASAIGATTWTVYEAMPALTAALTTGAIGSALRALRETPVIRVVFWPFHALVAPVFARTSAEWSGSIGWALILLGACYVWVVRTGVAFEEAAMQRSERMAAQRAARRSRGDLTLRASRIWPPLPPKGRPAAAIAWKVVVAFQRFVPLTRAAIFTLLFLGVVLLSMPGERFGVQLMGFGMLGSAVLLAVMGPLFVRTDLQQDMLMLPLLRSYPLSGRTIVVAEIAGTVAVLSAAQLALVVAGFALLAPLAGEWMREVAPSRALSAAPVIISRAAPRAGGDGAARRGRECLGGTPARVGASRSRTFRRHRVARPESAERHGLVGRAPAPARCCRHSRGRSSTGCSAGSRGRRRTSPPRSSRRRPAGAELWFIVEWLGAVLARTDPAVVEAATAS